MNNAGNSSSAVIPSPGATAVAIAHGRAFALGMGLVALGVAALVLVGWWIESAALTAVIPGGATMKPSTAMCFALAGIALWSWTGSITLPAVAAWWWVRLVGACGGVVAAVAALTLAEHVVGFDSGIHELVFHRQLLATAVPHPGRPAIMTAVGFLLLGTALAFGDVRMRRDHWPAQYLALLVVLIGFIAVQGYLFDARQLSSVGAYSSMAVHTALLMVGLGLGVLLARCDQGLMSVVTSPRLGGTLARGVLPLIFVVPIVVGLLRWQGEKAGWYTTGFGLVLFAMVNTLVFTLVVWRAARSLNGVDEERARVETDHREAAILLRQVNARLEAEVARHKDAEAARQESEHRSRQIAEALPQLVWTCQPDGPCDYLSRQWVEYTGLAEREQLGSGWLNQIHPDDRARLMEAWQASVGSGTPFRIEFRIRRHDGFYRWFDTRAVPLYDAAGHIVKWFGSNTDIHEQRETREALRESEARKTAILESALDCIITADREGRIIEFNPAAEKTFGYTRAELAGRELAETIIPLRWRERHRQGLARYLATGVGSVIGRRIEIDALRADGAEFPVELAVNATLVHGQPVFTAYLRDITERQQAEAALRQAKQELETKVAERTAELQTAKERAEESDHVKSAFLTAMSHELRTPLNAIIGFTGILLMKLPGPLTDDQEKQLGTIQTSARHLLGLINDLLDLAKIESGKRELSLEPVACQLVVQEVAQSMNPLAQAKGLPLEATVSPPELTVQADRRALSQILLNLTSNAIKFTEKGRVCLRVGRRWEAGRTLTEFSVSDTGIGIKPEDQARLFQAFTQAESTRHRHDGTGLGLHLSGKLAGLLGGHITLQSEPGQGSTFTLVLVEG